MIDSRRTTRTTFAQVWAITIVLTGVLTVMFGPYLGAPLRIPDSVWMVIAVAFVAFGIGQMLLEYLRGQTRDDRIDPELARLRYDLAEEVLELQDKIATMTRSLDSIRIEKADVTPEERQAIISAVRTDLATQITDELESRYAAASAEKTFLAHARKTLETTNTRLRDEIAVLTRRGNLNLVIGSITTGFAVGLLSYMVLGAQAKFAGLPDLLAHYIPRVTTVAFIEIFAFFFLKLYRSTLNEMFYQNELTNLALHSVAIESALARGDDVAKRTIIEKLATVDRNASTSPLAKPESREVLTVLEQVAKVAGEAIKAK